MQLFLGILLLVMSIFLVIAVLMQNGKSKRLSGSIAGGAETFFGKAKSRTIDAVLSKITTVVAILFVLTVIIVYVAFGSSTDNYLTQEDINNMIENGEIVLDTATENNLDVDDTTVEDNATVEDEATTDETVTDETVTDETVTDEAVEEAPVADDEK